MADMQNTIKGTFESAPGGRKGLRRKRGGKAPSERYDRNNEARPTNQPPT